MNDLALPTVHPAGLTVRNLTIALALVLIFLVVSGNARWIWWSGLWPSLLIPPFLWLFAKGDQGYTWEMSRRGALLTLCLTGLALIAGVSAIVVDPSELTILQWLGSYVSPGLLYVGLMHVRFSHKGLLAAWAVVTIGALIPLVWGLVAYYAEWGIPTGAELLLSRYDLERMAGYMQATFGNTSNTAALLALLIPMWIALFACRKLERYVRTLALVAVVVAFLHVLIVQSRTLFLVLVLIIPAIAYFFRVRFIAGLTAVLVLSAFLILPFLEARDRLLELTAGAFEGSADDQSVSERFEAMRIGIRLMLDNPALGIGPGNSSELHVHTSAHQYWINQGAETGVLGLILSFLLSAVVFTWFVSRVYARADSTRGDIRFPAVAGATGFMLYGSIANMPLSATAVNVWIGLFAILLAMGDQDN